MSDSLDRLKAALGDRYEFEQEIGAGGMATVYLARDVKHERRVAVKVLRPELAAALGPDRFPREIKILAQLSHPHILPLHDSGEAEGFLYYVMPYVDGESLRQKLEREDQLPIAETIRILREVVDALAYAHQHGVVHRDIKPDNVMLSGRHAIVTDFGVAKAVSAAGGEKLTTVGVALGTPTCMAHEQAAGETHLDQRADLYAVGAMAYEMLTGRPPFEGKTAQAILSAHVMTPPKEITEERPTVPRGLASLVMRCLEKHPADRWQNAEEMLPHLETLATPSGGITPMDTAPVRAWPRRRGRAKRIWAGGLAAAVVVLAGLGGWLVRGAGAGGGSIERIAVLPIQDLSGVDQIFVDGMHDALITALAQHGDVTIVSRSAVMKYRDAPATTREIARELDVDALLEGTVFRDGARMRINLQLVEPETLRHVWIESYERDVDDVLAVQSEVVETVATDLPQALSAENEPGG